MEWLADRFFKTGRTWTDAATGAAVHILVEQASGEQSDWDEQCARLSRARHPLLNPLIDFGPLNGGRRFEAYASLPDVSAGSDGRRLLEQATQFLRHSGMAIAGVRSHFAFRQVVASRDRRSHPPGITLQPRRALQTVEDVLDAPSAAPSVTTVVGSSSSGLRTLQLFVARAARRQGFMPICPSVLAAQFVEPHQLERHFCLLEADDGSGARDFPTSLVRIAASSARRHVVIRFARRRGQGRYIPLDPMSVRALVGMVHVAEGDRLTEETLFTAARLAEGRPGAFLARLTYGVAADNGRTSSMVHESPQEYTVVAPCSAVVPETTTGRTLRAALRARARADVLAGQGRHLAAIRLLSRGARVLSGRGKSAEAAGCLLHAGGLALVRGRTTEAAALFDDARRIHGEGEIAVFAGVGLGDAWMLELRLVESEAVLRAAVAAAGTLPERAALFSALTSLVRCLNEQNRPSEALAICESQVLSGDGPGAVEYSCELSHSNVLLGRTAAALHLVREAEARAAGSADPRLHVVVSLALAQALAAAGDLGGAAQIARRARTTARAAHQPLHAVDARLLQCRYASEVSAGADRATIRRLQLFAKLDLPPLHRTRLDRLTADLGQKPSVRNHDANDDTRGPAGTLAQFLQICHRSADDGAAVAHVCAEVINRLGAAACAVIGRGDRRVLATQGRGWSSSLVDRTFAAGQGCATEPGVEPREVAEPVYHGEEIVAALVMRWNAGRDTDRTLSAVVLRSAALAVAVHVRHLLESAPPVPPPSAWADLLGNSPAAAALRDAVARAARAPFPVLVEGESGCGKELVARAIHKLGPRRDRRFCAVNCAALTDELLESELFGHARGAFTGAAAERTGLFEEADGGTLFLDEIAELSPRGQAKLLRVLQEGEVRRIGENFPRKVDVRIVAATNRRLAEEVPAGRFRADLRFRLDVVRIVVPSLRDRPDDIPTLAAHFWADTAGRVDSRAVLTSDALAALARYDWPGNVRELQNVIAWIAVHSPRRGRIGPAALPAHVAQSAATASRTFVAAREDFERRFVRAALAGADGRMSRAAKALGVSRQGLTKIMRRLQLGP